MKRSTRRVPCQSILLLIALTLPAAAETAPLRERVCLNGLWLIHLGGDEWTIPSAGYQACRVPGKFGGEFRGEFAVGADGRECGWYRLDFAVPAEWKNKRITLDFIRVNSFAKIFLDGNLVGDHPDGNTPFSVDLTGKALPGQTHRLHVFVQGTSRFVRKSDGTGVWPIGPNTQVGILDDVTLSVSPFIYADDIFIMTSVRKKLITAQVTVRNASPCPEAITIQSHVTLGAEKVLDLPNAQIRLSPGETRMIQITREWKNPKLWGHPPYGTPTLYHFACTLADGTGLPLDTSYTRFGFREFRIDGDKFLLNERPIFLQGEQAEFRTRVLYPVNRQWLTTFYHAMRGANIDFVRMAHGIFWPVWADVADETGMLLEAEATDGLPTPGFGNDLASGALVLAVKAQGEWLDSPRIQKHLQTIRDFVREWRNHPSVILWSTDNEGGRQSGSADIEYFKSIKKMRDLIRSLDPTRPVDHEGSPLLAAAQKLGVDFTPDIYNIHPYSDPITADVTKFAKRHLYSGQPILIGELFNDYPKIQPKPTAGMSDQDRKKRWADAQAFADYWYRNILAAKAAGYDGTVILTLANTGFCGFIDEKRITAGSFGRHSSLVPVMWPSLSGPGPKVENTLDGNFWDGFNWFDPAKPAYIPDYIYQRVKQAYHEINGGDLAPLPPTRCPELIVTLTYQTKPVPNTYVYLVPAAAQPTNTLAVRTDAAGTAWFQIPIEGKFTLEFRAGERTEQMPVELHRGKLDAKPGYGHIQRVTFNLSAPPPPVPTNQPDGRPADEPDIIWNCLPQPPADQKTEVPLEGPNYINLVNAIDDDGNPTRRARGHDLHVFLKGKDVTKGWKNWSGQIWIYPDLTKADAFTLLMPAPQPGKYEITFHNPVLSPELSCDMYVGNDPKPRLNLTNNAADLGLEFCVAGRDARFALTLAPKDIIGGRVRLRFQSTSWMPAQIRGITLKPQ